jgi:hypothetical protein
MDRPYNRPYYDYNHEYPTISPPRSWSSYTSADSEDSLDEDGYPIDAEKRNRRRAQGLHHSGSYNPRGPVYSETSTPSSPESSRRAGKQPEQVRNAAEEKVEEKESMASWIGRITGSREAQFAATAVVSGAVVAGAIFGYQNVRRRERVGELKADIPDLNDRTQGHSVGEVC